MERGSRKRSLSARSEKMERVGDRQEKIEVYYSTGQSPQRAVVPMEKKKRMKYSVRVQCNVLHTKEIYNSYFQQISPDL
jgi:hypothetical protein